MSETIQCPYCQSEKWSCWDERSEWFEDTSVPEDDDYHYFEMPVGYLKCLDCGKSYIDYDSEPHWKHLGSYEDAFGYEDEW